MPAPRDVLKPLPLQRGGTIGIVAPASNIQPDALAAGIERLQQVGYNVIVGDSVYARDLYFAGTAEARSRDLMLMFERSDVQAILCARGGYGSNYLLPRLDLDAILQHPKILIGYSDLTSLLTWIHDETGLVTFHGPMAAKDFAHHDGVHLSSWLSALEGRTENLLSSSDFPGLKTLFQGAARGTLYGGCLSILAASIGTPYEIETGGTIFFLEDIATKPYQVDRMLMQLKYAGAFDGVKAVIFGEMLDCAQPGGQDYTLENVILRVLGDLGIPIVFGLPSGHVQRNNVTLPIGVEASLQAREDSVTLTILESAVSTVSECADNIRQ